MKKLAILVVIILFMNIGLLSGCTKKPDITPVNEKIIQPDAFESPIRKYFTSKKILWTMDDYFVHIHFPPNKGFDGLSQQIHSYGGHVNIMAIFAPPWILENFGYEIRNYSIVKEFAPLFSGYSQDNINKSKEFFNRSYISLACHEWSHSESERLNKVNLSQAYKTVNFSLWNWYNNFHIKPHFWLGRSSTGNYNISVALKRFSETYWTVYAEYFSNIDKNGKFPNNMTPAIEILGNCCDPGFGWDWGTCETLPEAQKLFVDYMQEHEVIFMRCHPAELNDTKNQKYLKLWQDFIDWIYQKHDLININHTQAIEYKIDRNNFKVEKNNENNYTINLSLCQFNHNVTFSPPHNDSDQWELYDGNGNKIGIVEGDTFFLLEKGHSYYFTRLTYT